MEGSRSPLNAPVQSFQDLELLIVSGYTQCIHGERRSGYPRAPTRERERVGGREEERER